MTEQSIPHRQGTEFQPGNEVYLHEAAENLKSYSEIEAQRLINEAYANVDTTRASLTTMALEERAMAQPEVLASADRIALIGLHLDRARKLTKSDVDLAA